MTLWNLIDGNWVASPSGRVLRQWIEWLPDVQPNQRCEAQPIAGCGA